MTSITRHARAAVIDGIPIANHAHLLGDCPRRTLIYRIAHPGNSHTYIYTGMFNIKMADALARVQSVKLGHPDQPHAVIPPWQ